MSENIVTTTYNRHFLFWELIASAVIVALAAAFFVQPAATDISSRLKTDAPAIYSVIASVTGSLLGFTITGLAIILAFPPSERLLKLQKSKQYYTIFRVYLSAIVWLSLATGICVLGLATKDWRIIQVFYIVIFTLVVSTARLARCLWVLKSIVQIKHLDHQGAA